MFDLAVPETQFAIDVVREAMNVTQRVRAVPALAKSDHSPVTVADFAAQAIVGRQLVQTFPDDVLVAEEDTAALRTPEQSETLAEVTGFVKSVAADATEEDVCAWIDCGRGEPGRRFWVLDPVDGTKGFLRGGQYAECPVKRIHDTL